MDSEFGQLPVFLRIDDKTYSTVLLLSNISSKGMMCSPMECFGYKFALVIFWNTWLLRAGENISRRRKLLMSLTHWGANIMPEHLMNGQIFISNYGQLN